MCVDDLALVLLLVLKNFLNILTFQAGYTATVVALGCTLLGIAAGVVGCFALLRKRALMGDALAHATLPGIAAAFLVVSSLAAAGYWPSNLSPRSLPVLLTGAAISGVLGILATSAIEKLSRRRIGHDASVGIVLSVFFGLGYVLLSIVQQSPSGNQAGLKTFILGQAAAMSPTDALLLATVALLVISLCTLLHKELRLVCFDEALARTQGWPVGLLDLVMMGMVVLVVVVGLQAVGLILVVALLIIPPAAARFWTDRLGPMVIISAGIGGASGFLGTALSAQFRGVPTGAIVVLIATAIFTLSALFAPESGMVGRLLRRRKLTRQIEVDHALRAVFELLEQPHASFLPHAVESERVPMSQLARELGPASAQTALRALQRAGAARLHGSDLVLTPQGMLDAVRTVRNHRLWEQFLVTHAAIAPTHVHRSADVIEHVLGPDIIAELEELLAARGRLPTSVHPIGLAPVAAESDSSPEARP